MGGHRLCGNYLCHVPALRSKNRPPVREGGFVSSMPDETKLWYNSSRRRACGRRHLEHPGRRAGVRKKGNDDMKQDKQAGGLAGIYQATSRGFGFLVPEDGGGGRTTGSFRPGRRAARGTATGCWPGRRTREGRRAGGAPPGLPPWWSGPTRRSPACWSGTTGGCGSGRTVTGCPAPSRCSPSGRGCGPGIGPPGHDQLRKRQAPAHGYHAGVFGPAGDRESAVAALLYQYEIDREFPDAVMLEAKATPSRWRRAPSPGGWTCGTRW